MAKDFSALLDELKGYDFSGMYNADFLHTWDKTTPAQPPRAQHLLAHL